jgi:hypothetical protein
MGIKQIIGTLLCGIAALTIVGSLIWFPWVTATHGRMLGVVVSTSLEVAVAIILFRLSGKQWVDRGFLKTNQGKPFYWPKAALPLAVWFDPKLAYGYSTLWAECVAELEEALGVRLVLHPEKAIPEMVEVWSKPDGSWPRAIYVQDDEGTDPLHGTTEHLVNHATGEIVAAKVTCPEKTLREHRGRAKKLVAHELRHVFGLDHDEGHGLVMHPELGAAFYEDHPDDIVRLKKAYG